MRTLPLNVDADKASALFLLIDIALRSLSAEKDALEDMKITPDAREELSKEKINELIEHVNVLSEAGKELSIEVGAIVDELGDDEKEFIPVVKSPK